MGGGGVGGNGMADWPIDLIEGDTEMITSGRGWAKLGVVEYDDCYGDQTAIICSAILFKGGGKLAFHFPDGYVLDDYLLSDGRATNLVVGGTFANDKSMDANYKSFNAFTYSAPPSLGKHGVFSDGIYLSSNMIGGSNLQHLFLCSVPVIKE